MSLISAAACAPLTATSSLAFQITRVDWAGPRAASRSRATSVRSSNAVRISWPPSSLEASRAPASIAASKIASSEAVAGG